MTVEGGTGSPEVFGPTPTTATQETPMIRRTTVIGETVTALIEISKFDLVDKLKGKHVSNDIFSAIRDFVYGN